MLFSSSCIYHFYALFLNLLYIYFIYSFCSLFFKFSSHILHLPFDLSHLHRKEQPLYTLYYIHCIFCTTYLQLLHSFLQVTLYLFYLPFLCSFLLLYLPLWRSFLQLPLHILYLPFLSSFLQITLHILNLPLSRSSLLLYLPLLCSFLQFPLHIYCIYHFHALFFNSLHIYCIYLLICLIYIRRNNLYWKKFRQFEFIPGSILLG